MRWREGERMTRKNVVFLFSTALLFFCLAFSLSFTHPAAFVFFSPTLPFFPFFVFFSLSFFFVFFWLILALFFVFPILYEREMVVEVVLVWREKKIHRSFFFLFLLLLGLFFVALTLFFYFSFLSFFLVKKISSPFFLCVFPIASCPKPPQHRANQNLSMHYVRSNVNCCVDNNFILISWAIWRDTWRALLSHAMGTCMNTHWKCGRI